jgi:hypothetical protein
MLNVADFYRPDAVECRIYSLIWTAHGPKVRGRTLMLGTIHPAQVLRTCSMSAALGHAALQAHSKCSFTIRKFRFLVRLRLA